MLTADAQHRKVFPEAPIVGFKRGKSPKDLLVRAKVPVEKVCTFLEEKNTFTNKEGSNIYSIREGPHLDCNSENVIYLITCKNAENSMQEVVLLGCAHVLIIRKFRKFCRDHFVIQVSFHAHCGIDDLEISLIDKGRNKQETRKKELFWQYKLDTFVPHSLNERVLDLEWM